MIWKITQGLEVFMISDGVGRLYQNLSRLGMRMSQTTQTAVPSRGEWPVAYPSRASRALEFQLPVMFPPCATLDEAFTQALDIPVQCPRGGVLTGLLGSTQRSYSQAWINDISVEPYGLTNLFTFSVSAINPTSGILSPLATMDARYIANLSAITALTGGGEGTLDGLVTADVAAGFTAFCTPTLAGFAQPKHMRLITDPAPGVTVTNDDPAVGTLIVLPVDYDETTNAKIWTEL